jgi:hypothetical protein
MEKLVQDSREKFTQTSKPSENTCYDIVTASSHDFLVAIVSFTIFQREKKLHTKNFISFTQIQDNKINISEHLIFLAHSKKIPLYSSPYPKISLTLSQNEISTHTSTKGIPLLLE